MNKAFVCEILTPEGTIYNSKSVLEAKIPDTLGGTFSILIDHTSMIAQVASGKVSLKLTDGLKDFNVTGGFLKINNNKLSIYLN